MIIIYTPEGGTPEEYDASTLKVSEVSIVQRTIDMKWPAIKAGLGDEDLDAMRGVAWVLKKRGQPSLRFAELDPGITEMVTRLDKKEVQGWVDEAVAQAARNPEVTPEQLIEALAELPDAAHDPEHARRLIDALAQDPKDQPDQEAPTGEENGEPQNPTLTSTSSGTSTSDSSPISATSVLSSSTS
ncbi:hypothetical protein ACW4TU_18395 [Streptomyces sp. QTS52]